MELSGKVSIQALAELTSLQGYNMFPVAVVGSPYVSYRTTYGSLSGQIYQDVGGKVKEEIRRDALDYVTDQLRDSVGARIKEFRSAFMAGLDFSSFWKETSESVPSSKNTICSRFRIGRTIQDRMNQMKTAARTQKRTIWPGVMRASLVFRGSFIACMLRASSIDHQIVRIDGDFHVVAFLQILPAVVLVDALERLAFHVIDQIYDAV